MTTAPLVDGRVKGVFGFAALWLTVCGVAMAVTARAAGSPHAGAVAAGATLDLVVVVPVAFVWLVARPLGLPVLSAVPVALAGLVLAAQIVPAGHQQTLRVFEALAVPAELGGLVWLARRVASARRQAGRDGDGDAVDTIRRTVTACAGSSRLAELLTMEAAMLYFGLAAWRARPHVPPGAIALTQERRSGHGVLLVALLHVLAVEGLVVHLLLVRWSPAAAWALTVAEIYGALWCIADYRATVLCPHLLTADELRIRAGLRMRMRAPRSAVVRLEAARPDLGRAAVNVAFPGTATHWCVLAAPVEASGPYGWQRAVQAIGLAPDDASLLASLGASQTRAREGAPCP